MAAVVWVDKCTGCGACLLACPVQCIMIVAGKAVVDEWKCVDCGACSKVCEEEAIITAV
ncbi:MAG: 4Fe-4S binding protein [Phycisphaerae bacterium]|nr:4Fe-4S binding protein [Phycisphaerae bacterium]